MKKLIAVAAILSVMFLGAGTSQALMGVPDAVPGRDVIVPFFIVSMDGFGNENSLIILTEVGGFDAVVADGTDVHLTVWNRESKHVHDEPIEYTAKDVWFTDGVTLVGKMSPDARILCEVDLDGDDVNDHYIGYVYFDNPRSENNLIAHAYQVSVGEGIVAGYLPVTLENYDARHDPMVQGYISNTVNPIQDFNLEDVEAFNADALWAAKCLELGLTPVTASNLMLYPRFYLHDELATNFLVVWTDEELPLAPPLELPGTVTINFYNEEEKVQSAPITIDYELNIIDITDIVPDGLWTDPDVDWPHGGWINFDIVGDPAFDARRYMLGYIIQRCPLAGGETLDVIFEAHRDASGSSSI